MGYKRKDSKFGMRQHWREERASAKAALDFQEGRSKASTKPKTPTQIAFDKYLGRTPLTTDDIALLLALPCFGERQRSKFMAQVGE